MKKNFLVRFSILTQIENVGSEGIAIHNAIDKICDNAENYVIEENVDEVKEDWECPNESMKARLKWADEFVADALSEGKEIKLNGITETVTNDYYYAWREYEYTSVCKKHGKIFVDFDKTTPFYSDNDSDLFETKSPSVRIQIAEYIKNNCKDENGLRVEYFKDYADLIKTYKETYSISNTQGEWVGDMCEQNYVELANEGHILSFLEERDRVILGNMGAKYKNSDYVMINEDACKDKLRLFKFTNEKE